MITDTYQYLQIQHVERYKPSAFRYVNLDDEEDSELQAPQLDSLDSLQAYFEELELELRQIEESQKVLDQNFYELTEMKHVLQQSNAMFERVRVVDMHSLWSFTNILFV